MEFLRRVAQLALRRRATGSMGRDGPMTQRTDTEAMQAARAAEQHAYDMAREELNADLETAHARFNASMKAATTALNAAHNFWADRAIDG